MALKTGEKVGLYEILALIGAGGMGEVYRARDPRLGRDVAIKVLPAALANDAERLSRFQREARVVAALNHPQIVTIYSVEEASGIHFLTMELVEGQTLDRTIPAAGLPAARIVEIGGELADALATAHEKGIVHRDLKPANIMVTQTGRVKVLDFGLAKELREASPEDVTRTSLSNTKAGMVLGTIAYMSPEQIAGAPVDHRTDIFSLGVVLYEMATGRQPFVGASSAERMSSILRDMPPSVSEIRGELPEDLSRIVRRCLEKDPRHRVQTARDVENEFRDLRQQSAIKTSGAGSGGHRVSGDGPGLTRSGDAGRGPRKANSLLLAAALVLAVLGAGYWSMSRPRPLPRVTGYTQITHDHLEKFMVGTDGSRLYFTQYSPRSLRQVAQSGGESAPLPVTLPKGEAPFLYGVSGDGSSLLYGLLEDGMAFDTLWVAPMLGGSARRLAMGRDAAFSPDGSAVAYMTPEGDILTVHRDGSGARKLASVGSSIGGGLALVWSPDGGALRFVRDNLLWEVSANGTNPRQVLPGWHQRDQQCCGRWSADGKTFFFASGASATDLQIWALDEGHGLLRTRSAGPVQLTTGPMIWSQPVPSRDGKKLFAMGLTERGELTRFDSRTRDLSASLGGISAEGVSFSGDGKFVAYVSFPEGILWKADRGGSNPVQLTEPPLYAFAPRWSPDGAQILFQDQSATVPSHVFIVPADGGVPRRILPDDKESEDDPNWSPDGRKIVFASGVTADPQKANLKILDLASGQVTLVPDSIGKWSPRWSPDGRFIASLGWDAPTLKVFDTGTHQWSALPVKGEVNFPCWSKDSQSLYFLSDKKDEHGVSRIRLHGTEAEQVADLKDWHSTGYLGFWLGLDPDDAPLLLRDIGSQDIYALNLDVK